MADGLYVAWESWWFLWGGSVISQACIFLLNISSLKEAKPICTFSHPLVFFSERMDYSNAPTYSILPFSCLSSTLAWTRFLQKKSNHRKEQKEETIRPCLFKDCALILPFPVTLLQNSIDFPMLGSLKIAGFRSCKCDFKGIQFFFFFPGRGGWFHMTTNTKWLAGIKIASTPFFWDCIIWIDCANWFSFISKFYLQPSGMY